ncbi:hypothetical protein IWQ61_000190, partial [Dispira simplex]
MTSKARRPKEPVRFARAVLLETRDTRGLHRNDHEEWIIRHLYQPVCPASTKDQSIRILNVGLEDGIDWQRTYREGKRGHSSSHYDYLRHRYRFTRKTTFYTLRRKYKIVFVIDSSPSMYAIDTQTGKMLIEQAFTAFKRCLKGLLQSPPWDKPQIFVTFAMTSVSAESSLEDAQRNAHLSALAHDMLITELRPDTIRHILRSAYQVIHQRAAEVFQSTTKPTMEDLQRQKIPQGAGGPGIRRDFHATFMLDVADYRLNLMPGDCAPVFVMIGDSTIRSNTGLDQLAFLTSALNRLDTKCVFIQVGSGQGANVASNFGYLPDNKASRFLAVALDGSFLYASDCVDIPWRDLPVGDSVTPDAPSNYPNLYHMCLLVKETPLVPPGDNLSMYNVVNRGDPRPLDEPRENYNELATRHFDISHWFDKFPWNPYSLPPQVDITRTRWRDYLLPVPLYMIIEGRLKEGFCVRKVGTITFESVRDEGPKKGLMIILEMIFYPNVTIQYQITPVQSFDQTVQGRYYRQYKVSIDIKPFSTFGIVLARLNDEEDFHTRMLHNKILSLEDFLERITQRDGMVRALSGIRPYYHGSGTGVRHPRGSRGNKESVTGSRVPVPVSEVPTPEQTLKLLMEHWDGAWREMVYFAKCRFNFAVCFVPGDCDGSKPFLDPLTIETRAQAKLLEFQQYMLSSWKATSIGGQSFVSFWPAKYSREEPSVNFCVHEWYFGGKWAVYLDIFFYNLSFEGRRQILADFPNRVRIFRSQSSNDDIVLVERPMALTPCAQDTLDSTMASANRSLYRLTAQASGSWFYRAWRAQNCVIPHKQPDEDPLAEKNMGRSSRSSSPSLPGVNLAVLQDHMRRLFFFMYAECLGHDYLITRCKEGEMVFYHDGRIGRAIVGHNMHEHVFQLQPDECLIKESEWQEPYDYDQVEQPTALAHPFVDCRGLTMAYMSFYTLYTPGLAFQHQVSTDPTALLDTTAESERQFFSLAALLPLNILTVVNVGTQPCSAAFASQPIFIDPAQGCSPGDVPDLTCHGNAHVRDSTGVVLEGTTLRYYSKQDVKWPSAWTNRIDTSRAPLLLGLDNDQYPADDFAELFRYWISISDPEHFVFFSTRILFERIMQDVADAVLVLPREARFVECMAVLDAQLSENTDQHGAQSMPSSPQFRHYYIGALAAMYGDTLWFVHRLPQAGKVLLASQRGAIFSHTGRMVSQVDDDKKEKLTEHDSAAIVTNRLPSSCEKETNGDGLSDNGREDSDTLGLTELFDYSPVPTTECTPAHLSESIINEASASLRVGSQLLVLEAQESHVAADHLVRFYRGQPRCHQHHLTEIQLGNVASAGAVRSVWQATWQTDQQLSQFPDLNIDVQTHVTHLGALYQHAYAKAIYSALLWRVPVSDSEVEGMLPHFSTCSVNMDITAYLKAQLFLLHNDGPDNAYHAAIRDDFDTTLLKNFEPLPGPEDRPIYLYRPERFAELHEKAAQLLAADQSKRTTKSLHEAFQVFMGCADSPLLFSLACSFRRLKPGHHHSPGEEDQDAYETYTVPIRGLPTSFEFIHEGYKYDFTPADIPSCLEDTRRKTLEVTLHFRCLMITPATTVSSPPAEESINLRRSLSSTTEQVRFQKQLGQYLPDAQCGDVSLVVQAAQQIMNQEILNGMMYCSSLTDSMLRILEANIRYRKAWDPIGTEYVREYGLQFVREDSDRMKVFVAELLDTDIKPYRFVPVKKIIYVEKIPPSSWITDGSTHRYHKRDFWLLLTRSNRDLKRLAYGPAALDELHSAITKLQAVFKQINFRTNQLLLLRRMVVDRRCSSLLLPPPKEGAAQVDTELSTSGGTTHSAPVSEILTDTDTMTSYSVSSGTEEPSDYHITPPSPEEQEGSSHPFYMDLGAVRDYKAGEFACDMVLSDSFPIHPRLPPNNATNTLKERCKNFRLQGENLYLITRKDPIYFAVIEERETVVEPLPGAVVQDEPSSPRPQSPGVLRRRSTDVSPSSYLSFSTPFTASGSGSQLISQVQLPKRYLCIEAYGARSPPAPEVHEFFAHVKDCLEQKAVLPAIKMYLCTSTDMTPEDMEFLIPHDPQRFQRLRFALHPDLPDPYQLLLYMRQTLLHQFKPYAGSCLRSMLLAHHTRMAHQCYSDFSADIPLADFAFFHNGGDVTPSQPRLLLGSGVLSLHIALVDSQARLIRENVHYANPTETAWNAMIDGFGKFCPADSATSSPNTSVASPSATTDGVYLVVDLWSAGNVNMDTARSTLTKLFYQAVCDHLVETALLIDGWQPNRASLMVGSRGRTLWKKMYTWGCHTLYTTTLDFPPAPNVVEDTLVQLARLLDTPPGRVKFRAYERQVATGDTASDEPTHILLPLNGTRPVTPYQSEDVLTYLKSYVFMACASPGWGVLPDGSRAGRMKAEMTSRKGEQLGCHSEPMLQMQSFSSPSATSLSPIAAGINERGNAVSSRPSFVAQSPDTQSGEWSRSFSRPGPDGYSYTGGGIPRSRLALSSDYVGLYQREATVGYPARSSARPADPTEWIGWTIFPSDTSSQHVRRFGRSVPRSYLMTLLLRKGECQVVFYNCAERHRKDRLQQLQGCAQQQKTRRQLLKSLTMFKLGLGHLAMADPQRSTLAIPQAVQPERVLPGNPKHLVSA